MDKGYSLNRVPRTLPPAKQRQLTTPMRLKRFAEAHPKPKSKRFVEDNPEKSPPPQTN